MKSLKLLVLFCVAISFSQCSTLTLTKSTPFKITGATYHDWVGGQPGVSGTNLIVGVANEANITFKKLYFHNQVVDARILLRKDKKYIIANLSTSNRINLIEKKEAGKKKDIKLAVKSKPIPFKLEPTEAVISYIVGKKTFYYKISNIKKTDTFFYP